MILERKCSLCPWQTVFVWLDKENNKQTLVGCADNYGTIVRGSCVIPYGYFLNYLSEALNAH